MSRCIPAAAVAALLLWPSACPAAEEPAGGNNVDTLLAAFLEKSSKATYVKVFEAVTSHSTYDPYSGDLDEAYVLVEKKDFKEAQARLAAAMPNLLLSPRAHILARRVAEGLGDAAEAKRQDQIARKCLEGILSTGRGDSPASPCLVTRTSDEYDVLRSLKRDTSFQSLRSVEGRHFDVFRYGEGKEMWFDITVVFQALNKRIRQE